jgi:CheY-like chemotaxis protein
MLNSKVILIVEDEPINRELLNIFLGKLYKLEFAENLEDAITHLNATAFNLIITDVRLGNKADGNKVLKYARKSAKNAGIPVLVYTASGKSINQKSFSDEGFDGMIAKPVLEKQLLEQIASFLNNTSANGGK